MKYLYFPGCSLSSTGRSFEESLVAVLGALGVSYKEIDDWNCCGATAYMSVDEDKALALAARNLALAEEQGEPEKDGVHVMAPCAACYLGLAKARKYLAEHADLRQRVVGALAQARLSYTGNVQVRHPLDVFVNDLGLKALTDRVKKPLKGLKVACYYGCQIVRPFATFDDQHNPKTMDQILAALGAEIVDWPLKTRCCGGTLTGTVEDVGLRLNYILLREAKRRGAHVIATACPLCQFNLECYQEKISETNNDRVTMPVAYFTQLMGRAYGLSEEELGLHRMFVTVPAAAAA